MAGPHRAACLKSASLRQDKCRKRLLFASSNLCTRWRSLRRHLCLCYFSSTAGTLRRHVVLVQSIKWNLNQELSSD